MNSLHCWLSRLPLDPRTQRAVEETVIDGRTEFAAATSMAGRVLVVLRNIVALARTVSVASLREIVWSLHPIGILRMAGFSIAIAVAIRAYGAWQYTYQRHFELLFFLRVSSFMVPVGAYLTAIADKARRPPTLALLVVAGALMTAGLPLLNSAPGAEWVGLWCALMLWTATLLLVADRVAREQRRWLIAVVALIAPGLSVAAYMNARMALVLYVTGFHRTVNVDWLFPAAYVVTWYVLVRRQERLQNSSGTNLIGA